MNASKIYWVGYEDGFEGCVFRDVALTNHERFAYRQGFLDGTKARNSK